MLDEHRLKEEILASTNSDLIPDHCEDIKTKYLMMKSSAPRASSRKKTLFSFVIPSLAVVATAAIVIAFALNNHNNKTVGYEYDGREQTVSVSLASAYNAISVMNNNLPSSSGKKTISCLNQRDGWEDEPWRNPYQEIEAAFNQVNAYANVSYLMLMDEMPEATFSYNKNNDYKTYAYRTDAGNMSVYFNETVDNSLYSMDGLMLIDTKEFSVSGSNTLDHPNDVSITVNLNDNTSLEVNNHSRNKDDLASCDYVYTDESGSTTYSLSGQNSVIEQENKSCINLSYAPNGRDNFQNNFLFYLSDPDNDGIKQLSGDYELAFGESGDWGVMGSFYGDFINGGEGYEFHGDVHGYFDGPVPPGDGGAWEEMPEPPEGEDWGWQNEGYEPPRCQGPDCEPYH